MFIGFYFFTKYETGDKVIWRIPWIILCISTSLNLFIDPLLAFFDGVGEISDMSRVRLIQKSSNAILLICFFLLGFKLYTSAIASLIAISINYFQIFNSKRFNILKTVWKEKNISKIDYYSEIFPFQWRIALSWISGYFIFQLFNPVLFATEGAKIAGQMGMSLVALNGVSTLSMSWITTKIPLFSSLIAKQNFAELDFLFDKTVKQLFIVSLSLIVCFIGSVFMLNYLNISLASRFLGLLPLTLMCLTVLANQFVFSWAAYLRCHKKEPFLFLSIITGLLCCLSTFILGYRFGLMGIIGGYTFIMLTVSLIWAYWIFKTKKRLWHG